MLQNSKAVIKLGLVGKYVSLKESYKSLNEAISHAGLAHDCKVEIAYVDPEELEQNNSLVETKLTGLHAIIVPGGFGSRGTEGKILAIHFAREKKIPFLGICLGMQLASIEFARNVAGIKDAQSQEFQPESKNPIIHYMEGQGAALQKGGTMRLGGYPCVMISGSLAAKLYGVTEVSERHRHRLEFNNAYREKLEAKGMKIVGASPNGDLVEIIELKNHPFFIGVQFHPEFLSKPMKPHPLFKGLVGAALERLKS
jgi:CTP synthase